jgi:hypothetical protein
VCGFPDLIRFHRLLIGALDALKDDLDSSGYNIHKYGAETFLEVLASIVSADHYTWEHA